MRLPSTRLERGWRLQIISDIQRNVLYNQSPDDINPLHYLLFQSTL
jgi:hypothetical protein